MFYGAAKFNGDVSKWDVSSVTDMSVSYQSLQYLIIKYFQMIFNTVYALLILTHISCFIIVSICLKAHHSLD